MEELFAKGEAPEVSHNVIGDDQASREDHPEDARSEVLDERGALEHYEEKRELEYIRIRSIDARGAYRCPGELGELILVHSWL